MQAFWQVITSSEREQQQPHKTARKIAAIWKRVGQQQLSYLVLKFIEKSVKLFNFCWMFLVFVIANILPVLFAKNAKSLKLRKTLRTRPRLYNVHLTVHHVLQLHTMHCTPYMVHCTPFTVHCTLYTVQCTPASTSRLAMVNCTLYTVYC